MNPLKPNKQEFEFLTLSYNRFYDLFDEIMQESFWTKNEWERFSKIKQGFDIYTELLNYEPLKQIIEELKSARPPMESEIGRELFKFVRNVISHFPYFNSWDDVWIKKSIVNWNRAGLTIDKFLIKYEGHEIVKYRFWEEHLKKMTYLSIYFPEEYSNDVRIYLKEILSEKEGVKFSYILMRKILDTQVVEITEK